MPGPFASPIVLTPEVHDRLQTLLRARSTPQVLVFRCRLILRAAAADRPNNQQIAAALDGDRHTVGHWRECFVAGGRAGLQDALAPADPGAFPPDELVAVVNLATSKTAEHDQPATRWSLDDLAAAIVNDARHRIMSRATIWRILDEADLKPPKSVYWLNSHDPDFDAKAQAICRLDVDAPRLQQPGRLVLCCDEKTGMQMLERTYPTQRAEPGKPEKRAFEYIRHGTRALITSFAVPTGAVVWNLGLTRTSADCGNHIGHVARHFQQFDRFDWVVDNLNTHWSRAVCAYLFSASLAVWHSPRHNHSQLLSFRRSAGLAWPLSLTLTCRPRMSNSALVSSNSNARCSPDNAPATTSVNNWKPPPVPASVRPLPSPKLHPSHSPRRPAARPATNTARTATVPRLRRNVLTRRTKPRCPTPVPVAAAPSTRPTSISNTRPTSPDSPSSARSTSTAAAVAVVASPAAADTPLQTSDATGAAASQLGPDAQAAVVLLHKDAGLSHGKIARTFDALCGITRTRGACAQIVLRAGRRLRPAYAAIQPRLAASSQITPDETGWRLGGHPAWLHAWVGDDATGYVISPQRDAAALAAVIGWDWSGVLIHDGFASYDRFALATHQQCVAHVLRRAHELEPTLPGAARRFPRQVIELFQGALQVRDMYQDGVVTAAERTGAYTWYVDGLQALTERSRTNAANETLARHLWVHADHWFQFLDEPAIPATNYQAEQALRPAVVNRKVWGGNRTEAGAEAQGVLSSVLQTCRQQVVSAVDYVRDTLCHGFAALFTSAPEAGR